MARRFAVPAWILTALLGGLLLALPARAQDAAAEQPSAKEAAQPSGSSASDTSTAEGAFQAKFNEWKDVVKHLRQLRSEFQTAEPEKMKEISAEWDATIAKGEMIFPVLIDAVGKAFEAAPDKDRARVNFLAKALKDYVARDLYDSALKIGNLLLDNGCDLTDVYRDTVLSAYALNQYARAIELLAKGEELGAISGDPTALRKQLEEYQKFWEDELKLRAKEAEADDLPRVKLTTSKGDIIVELFENEAPGTVGNFINLVKKGYYNGLTFHRVVSGFMAQGGCPLGDGTSGPGYAIYDECNEPGARKHFRGVLSMAKTSLPNSGGSQFFITYRPTPHLDGQHTVFGRVVEGMEVANALQRRDAQKPGQPDADVIIKAEVLRDRGHEYLPHKVE